MGWHTVVLKASLDGRCFPLHHCRQTMQAENEAVRFAGETSMRSLETIA